MPDLGQGLVKKNKVLRSPVQGVETEKALPEPEPTDSSRVETKTRVALRP